MTTTKNANETSFEYTESTAKSKGSVNLRSASTTKTFSINSMTNFTRKLPMVNITSIDDGNDAETDTGLPTVITTQIIKQKSGSSIPIKPLMIGLGVGVAIILIIVFVAVYVYMKKKRQKEHEFANEMEPIEKHGSREW